MSTHGHLILIPGSLNNARVWDGQTAVLGALAQVQVADVTQGDSTAAMAEAVLAAAPPRFALAGFSLGGYVALEVMRRAPERLSALALISTSARPENPEAIPGREKMMALAERDFDRMLANMRPFMLAAANIGNAELNAALDSMMRNVGAAVFVRQSRAVIGRADSRDLLPGIACPTLVAVGTEDRVTPPKFAEELAATIPLARLEVIPDAGHLLPMEAPAALAQAMRQWLSRI
jgi:pimeloyl-ACP methyl ester carboxylesterase